MAGLGALVGFASGLANYAAQQHQADKAFAHNKALAELQNKFNLDQWNRENAYNSPMAQMNRFKMAGLNPNLIYGQQNLAANSPELVGGTPYQSPNANIVDPHSIAELGLLKAQKENIEANTEKTLSDVDVNQSNISLNETQEELNNSMKNLNEAQTKKVNEEIPLIRTEVKRAFQEYRKLKVDADRANEFYDAQIRKLTSEAGLADAEARDIINTYKHRVDLLIAQANRENWDSKRLENECQILGEQYVQSTYATKVAEASSSVEGSKGYQWTNKVLGLVSEAVGTVGSVMLGYGALRGAGAIRSINGTKATIRSGYASNGTNMSGYSYRK